MLKCSKTQPWVRDNNNIQTYRQPKYTHSTSKDSHIVMLLIKFPFTISFCRIWVIITVNFEIIHQPGSPWSLSNSVHRASLDLECPIHSGPTFGEHHKFSNGRQFFFQEVSAAKFLECSSSMSSGHLRTLGTPRGPIRSSHPCTESRNLDHTYLGRFPKGFPYELRKPQSLRKCFQLLAMALPEVSFF